MATGMEHLAKLLDERDEKVAALEEEREQLAQQVAQLERDAERNRNWTEHRKFDVDPSPSAS